MFGQWNNSQQQQKKDQLFRLVFAVKKFNVIKNIIPYSF